MIDYRRVSFILMGFIFGGTVFVLQMLSSVHSIEGRVEIAVGQQQIIAEVARTEKERATGLSGRSGIGLNEGMLFIFDKPGSYGFWMKDMKFPIDIVWIREGKILGFSEYVPNPPLGAANELPLKVYYPPEEVDRVLELKAGRARLLQINGGEGIDIRPFVPKVKL